MSEPKIQKIENQAEFETKRKLLLNLIKRDCIFRGDFVLASGKKSNFYLDTRLVTLSPEGSFIISQLFYFYLETTILKSKVNFAVAGPCTGANPIVSGVSLLSYLYNSDQPGKQLKAAYIRKEPKEHGRTKSIEGPIQTTDKVILLEDVVTTGISSIKAIKSLQQELDSEVLSLLCLVRRDADSFKLIKEQTGIEKIKAIFEVAEILDTDKI